MRQAQSAKLQRRRGALQQLGSKQDNPLRTALRVVPSWTWIYGSDHAIA